MIEDARELPLESAIECDLCIIGGGPAGISIAHALRSTSLRVVILESGGRTETPEALDLNRGHVSPAGSHEPLEENRRRVFGGSTSVWGGRAVPFDEIDFAPRPWVPQSGWPLTKADLDPYYVRATALYEAGEDRFTVEDAFPGRQAEMIAGFDGRDVVSNRLERWGPPVHFGRRYGPDLQRAENVHVLLQATCVRLRTDAAGERVLEAEVACGARERRLRVRAARFVVAAGTLENARLLLASNAERPEGLGNAHDNVGRYYATHHHGAFSIARLHDIGPRFFYEFERDTAGVYCRRRFWLTPAAQERLQTLNAVAFFFRPQIADSPNASGLLSATHLAKITLGTFRRNGLSGARKLYENRAELAVHLRRVVVDTPELLPEFLAIIRHRFLAKRRLPFVLPPRRTNRFHLFFQAEHAPNRESRARLQGECDALGMPRLEAGLQFGEIDRRTIIELHRTIRAQFAATGTGELTYDEAALEAWIDERFRHCNSTAFQTGTTRMSADPRTGVVDAQCRVHGMENLFIAGASVYATSGHANPALTLIALALRLADHLRETRR